MATKPTTTQERIGCVGQRRQVVIPREIFEKLNMREGGFVEFTEKTGGVLIRKRWSMTTPRSRPKQPGWSAAA